ncbi:DUF1993 domain-containing protein [Sorangium sp. So ce131]|uniref:DUF1993 domain-containing protein n=1 Tax=Sorangium sp. So ce131 TaxID=3133282 RepID=UPI003F5ED583
MAISMYQSSIPVLVRMLGNLSAILTKAEAYAQAKKIEPRVLIEGRLSPDMFPLARQVQIATDMAKGCGARLAGVDLPKYEDNEATFDELQARLAKTIAFLNSLRPEQIDGSEDRDITIPMGNNPPLQLKGLNYLLYWVQPNFYFHVTTAYAILRHNGLEIGKMDYLGPR